MNTQLNIKTWRLLFSPTFVTLLIGIVVVLVLGGPSVQAQTTATPATVDSSITLTGKGAVSDPNGSITVMKTQTAAFRNQENTGTQN